MFSVILFWILLISMVVAAAHQAVQEHRNNQLDTGGVVFASVVIALAVFGMVRIWPWTLKTIQGIG